MSPERALPSAQTVPTRRGLRFAWHYLRGAGAGRSTSAAVGVGLFIGCLPLFGLHLPLCLVVCLPLRLDAVLAYIAANISNPVVAPFLLLAEVQTGSLLLQGRLLRLTSAELERVGWSSLVLETIVGSLVVGSVVALVGALLTWPLARRVKPRRSDDFEDALRRLLQRYRGARTADRFYVPMKLLADPVVPELLALPGAFGDVLDAGAGRGQLALLLLELGRARTVRGFDWDEAKVMTAQGAAGESGTFNRADLRSAAWPPSDTVLLIDVLHYLDRREQTDVLRQAASCLRAGGRLVIRDADARAGVRSRLTQAFEHIGARVGYNRAEQLDFRTARELTEELQRLGLEVSAPVASGGTWLSNVLIVARARDGAG